MSENGILALIGDLYDEIRKQKFVIEQQHETIQSFEKKDDDVMVRARKTEKAHEEEVAQNGTVNAND